MLKRPALIALAAVAAIGFAAVSTPTTVEAAPGFSRGSHGLSRVHIGHFRGHVGRHIGFHRNIHIRRHVIIRPSWCWRHPWSCRRPIHIVRPFYPVTTYPVAYAAPVAAAPRPCTCLTKEYLPNGAVLFKDVCTKEFAANPPLEQSAEVQPQQ